MPEIIFSNICQLCVNNKYYIYTYTHTYTYKDIIYIYQVGGSNNVKTITCSLGFKLSTSNALSYSVKGRCDDLKLPHSMFMTYTTTYVRLVKKDFQFGTRIVLTEVYLVLTISPDLGGRPCHFGIAWALST